MKKVFISIIFLLLLSVNNLLANQVSIEETQNVATNWYLERCKEDSISQFDIVETYTESRNSGIVFYIFNFTPSGFVIVSADDISTPVLGYSKSNSYETINHPPAFDDLLECYTLQIDYARDEGIIPFQESIELWQRLSVNPEDFVPESVSRDVEPLLTTTWNQGQYFNEMCPYDENSTTGNNYVLAGCIATAMAQVMKYWSYPTTGTGSYSYTPSSHPEYGIQAANFGATTYNWANMPNSVTSLNTDVQTLLYHCGVSVDMDYGPDVSIAYMSDVVNALNSYFDYDPSAQKLSKNNYSELEWAEMLRDELDIGRPLIYCGSDPPPPPQGGHAFNLDGYEGTNHFHFNWGWSGSYNGYYYLSDLNPGGHNYTQSQAGILGLEPYIPLPGTIQGTVTLSGGTGDVEDVKVGAGDQIVNPNQDGGYCIEIEEGTYNVTAYLPGYGPQTIQEVEVIEGQTTTGIDFSLDEGFVVYVHQDGIGDYLTIHAGIDAAEDCDIIVVADGIYTGTNNTNLSWNGTEKHLTVRSENGPDDCIIRGTGTETAFNLNEAETTYSQDRIIGFTLSNLNIGISCTDSPGLLIYDNVIINCNSRGIFIDNCNYCLITYNDFNYCYCYDDYPPKGGAIYSDSPGLISYNDIENCNTRIYGDYSGEGGGIWATNIAMTIRDNTISYCESNEGGGIYSVNAHIFNNVVEDCTVQGWGGGGISGGAIVENNTIRRCSSIVVPDGTDGWGGYGGGIIDGTYIRNNIFENNSSRNGGNVTINCQYGAEITGNEFYNNTMSAGTLIFSGASAIGVECDNVLILDNIIVDGVGWGNGGAICLGYYVTDIDIINNTIVNNENESGIYIYSTSANNNDTIFNNIVAFNESGIVSQEEIEVLYCNSYDNGYCNYYGVIEGDGCISEPPLFTDPNNNDYSLLWNTTNFSPCIDTGDPNEIYNDADGTPSDMGAIPAISHDYFINQYDGEVFDRIEWISFPALNRTTNNYMEALNVLERQSLIFPDYPNDDILDHVLYENYPFISFENGSWQNNLPPDGDFHSEQGYKVVLQEGYYDIPMKGISGTWENESTPIQLYANKKNWVGCFLEEPALFADAFESISDEWTLILSEHWAVERIPEEPTSHIRGTVNPGELYIIRVENDCQLIWNNSGGGVEPYIREKTNYFTYEETVDYMAIDIDTVYSDTTIAEIAIYSDDQCIGASKVSDGYPVQILAYTPDTLKNGNNGLEFMLLYEGQKRGSSKSIPYITYSKEAQAFIAQPLYYERNTFSTVQLNTDEPSYTQQIALMKNYPNPVRTNTTQINFMPEQKAQHTELNIYNLKGQLIRTIDCDGIISSGNKNGYYSLTWDCRNRNGKDVKNGIYFYKLTSGEKSTVNKMLIMK